MNRNAHYLTRYENFPRRWSPRALLRDVALRALSLSRRDTGSGVVRVFYCHYVFDDQVAEFERKILFLKEQGHFVSADTMNAILAGGSPADENFFHISFDDGFRNIVKNALPVLERHGVPSTFFVPSSIIGADSDTVADYCLRTTNYPRVIEVCSWDDLKRAADKGMTIGSHTRTHACFSEISANRDRLVDEIAGSKAEIEKKMGGPCQHISWPYGRVGDADEGSLEFVEKAGYATCFGAFRGQVRPGKTSPYRIPRHHFEPQWPESHFRYFALGGGEGA